MHWSLIKIYAFHLPAQANAPVVQNGLDKEVAGAAQGISELTFEEDDEDQYYTKDLPSFACT